MANRHSVSSETRARIVLTVMREALAATGEGDGIFTAPCAACGNKADRRLAAGDPNRLVMGHVVSDADGGTYEVANLLPTCEACNDAMGAGSYPRPRYMLADVTLMSAAAVAAIRDAGARARQAVQAARRALWL